LKDSIEKKIKCPICTGENTKRVYHARLPQVLAACSPSREKKHPAKDLEIWICFDDCLGFTTAAIEQSSSDDFYDEYNYISPSSGLGLSQYEGMISAINNAFEKGGSLLEIGCSDGYILSQLKERGFSNIFGIEPGPLAKRGIERGLPIKQAFYDEDLVKGQKFDGIYLMHVFEHLMRPDLILKSFNNILSDSGKIILEVPNFTGIEHEYLYYFTDYGLKKEL
jgi:SAM-dependent methyltransferase